MCIRDRVAPSLPVMLSQKCSWIYFILKDKYGFDRFNDWVFVRGANRLADSMYHMADVKCIDDFLVNGSGRSMTALGRLLRRFQSGLLYQYILIMIVGLLALLYWILVGF